MKLQESEKKLAHISMKLAPMTMLVIPVQLSVLGLLKSVLRKNRSKNMEEIKILRRFYTPRLSSKEGKKIKEKFDEFDDIDDDALNRIVGMRSIIRTVGCNIGKGAF